jgi:UDP-2,3-diacylglucosamine hydrolase
MLRDKKHITFVSDTHFKDRRTDDENRRRASFLEFLDRIPEGGALFLLGDIFDFYFEFRSSVYKNYFDIFDGIYRVGRRGVEIHFIGGNHDSWTGSFISSELGAEVHREEALFEAQGRRLLCAHGDLHLPGDFGYKALKSVIRNPFVVQVAGLVHPDLLAALARGVSKGSKKVTRVIQRPLAEKLSRIAFDTYFGSENDVFIMGHVHFPIHVEKDGKDFVILGDWLEHYSYAVLEGGRIEIKKFTDRKQD